MYIEWMDTIRNSAGGRICGQGRYGGRLVTFFQCNNLEWFSFFSSAAAVDIRQRYFRPPTPRVVLNRTIFRAKDTAKGRTSGIKKFDPGRRSAK